MEKLNVKVEYIFHSGFTVETKDHFLVFDYYKGDLNIPDKKTYVFVSHGHEDHLNTDILDLEGDVQYIFSDDIELDTNKNIHYMKAYKSLDLDGLHIQTFSSTDLGVSFLVKLEGISLFFAGDLNWWYWNNDSQEEKEAMEYLFKKKIGRLEGEKVDIAFFPVDPRLEENYYMGGKYFIEKLHPKYFFQMHFGDNYGRVKDFIHKMKDTGTEIVDISHTNQTFEL